MRTKQEVEKELREIERAEEIRIEEEKKQRNYEKFKEREEDWMIGKAHADVSFIGEKYFSDMRKPLIPVSVSVSGNCGTTYYPKALLTNASKTFFHNVWSHSDENGFQQRLNDFVQKEIEQIARKLHNVLEMMGLQSHHYFITTEFFPKDKVKEVKDDVEKARWEILDRYEDKDFEELIRHRVYWTKGDDEREKMEEDEVDLSHSRMILYRYIFNRRPSLQERFRATKFYEQWKDQIEAEYD